MTQFLQKLASNIHNSDGYKQASNNLFNAYIQNMVGSEAELKRSEVKKLIASAQALYKSDSPELKREGAIILAMMLDICAKDYPDVVPIANKLFADAGDFPNIKLLNDRHPELEFTYNFYTEAQIGFREDLNTVNDLKFPLTDFQRTLWEDLKSGTDVITSAPTSAGKTHIILNYLLKEVVESDGAFAAIIVPTRALISEVSGKIYELAKEHDAEDDIEICTVPRDEVFKEKTLFVMTQERLHEILLQGDITFDFLFIDEAHNITDKSRGVLLHLTIEKLLEDSLPQVIISMPSQSYQDSFSTIFRDVSFEKRITQLSPVEKIMMSVVPKGLNLIISRKHSDNSLTIPKNFKGTRPASIVYKLGKNQSNIIYRNRTDYCEDFANELADLIPESEGHNPLLEEAANYVETFIHEDFSLADNLRKGVAFHYGPLPGSIRGMVESLVKDDHIQFIACTGTLAEGVNLPAKNLFLQNPFQPLPYQSPERIENVKINNITGRAGRMLEHFSGNIFLIEPEKWNFQDYFEDEVEDDEKIPTYFKSLNEDFTDVIAALRGNLSHNDENQYRLYSIANKLIKEFSSGQLENTLEAKELTLDTNNQKLLTDTIEKANGALQVSSFTLEANPTVGYIQQNKLFEFLDQTEDLDGWVLPHPKSGDLYITLLKVTQKLREFGIFVPIENNSLKHICSISKKWVQGNHLKSIISEQIAWETRYAQENNTPPKSTNSCVRGVIKVINNDVRFRLSNALKCYQILLGNVLARKKHELPNVKLHSFIEIGACDERMINLISMGISREAAKEIDEKLPAGEDIRSPHDLLTSYRSGRINDIHNVTKKELEKLLSQ